MILHLFLEFRENPWDEISVTSKYQALKGCFNWTECLMGFFFFLISLVCGCVCVPQNIKWEYRSRTQYSKGWFLFNLSHNLNMSLNCQGKKKPQLNLTEVCALFHGCWGPVQGVLSVCEHEAFQSLKNTPSAWLSCCIRSLKSPSVSNC